MSESKIVLALEKFKVDYAWDLSLINPDTIPSNTNLHGPDTHSATYLEDFIRSQQAAAQTDSGGY